MYKLCFALACLAVAAAQPTWPVASYYPYPASGYAPAVIPAAPLARYAHAYPAPAPAPVAPVAPVAAPVYPTSYSYTTSHLGTPLAAPVAPGYGPVPYGVGVAPFGGFAYGSPFAWQKK